MKTLKNTVCLDNVGGAGWLCGAVLGSWPKDCEFDPDSWQLLSKRCSTLSLTLAELYGVKLPSLWGLFNHLY